MIVAFYGLMAGAAVLAWVLTLRRPEHRPVAMLLTAGLVLDVGLGVLGQTVVAPIRASLGVAVPWTGWAEAVAVLYNAVALAWPFALLAASLAVFTRRSPWFAFAGWGLAVALFAVLHPIAGDGSQARFLTFGELFPALVSAVLVVFAYRSARRPASSAEFALAVIVAAEVVSLLGAWRVGLFQGWPVTQGLYMVVYATLVIAQGRFLWTPQPSS